jgi:hypothetical protein
MQGAVIRAAEFLDGSHTIQCGIQITLERLPLRMIYGETRPCRQSGPTDSDAQATGQQGDRSPWVAKTVSSKD